MVPCSHGDFAMVDSIGGLSHKFSLGNIFLYASLRGTPTGRVKDSMVCIVPSLVDAANGVLSQVTETGGSDCRCTRWW